MIFSRYELSDAFLGKQFREVGIRQGWWDMKDPVVLAVSGGGDSMALLWFFSTFWPGEIVVAHIEHGIRGTPSFQDAQFVRNFSETLGVSCVVVHTVVERLRKKGETLEEAARRVRYSILGIIQKERKAWGIAFGQNSDDRVETMLLNLFRGAGFAGLSGIPERRGAIVRPLLSFSRETLRSILAERNIPWCEDETNQVDIFTRNRIRLECVPWIEKNINPRVKERLLDLADEMFRLRVREENRISSLLKKLEHPSPLIPFVLRRSDFTVLDSWDRALLLKAVGTKLGLTALSRARLNILCRLCEKGERWTFQWQGDWVVQGGSGDFIGWVRPFRTDWVDRNAVWTPIPGRSLSWGGWIIECSAYPPGSEIPEEPERITSISFSQSKISVSSSAQALADGAEEARAVPWFCRSIWPVLKSGQRIFVPFWKDPATLFDRDGIRIVLSPSI